MLNSIVYTKQDSYPHFLTYTNGDGVGDKEETN